MHRFAPRLGQSTAATTTARPSYVTAPAPRVSAPPSAMLGWLLGIGRVLIGASVVVAVALVGPGVFLDTPQPPPQRSDAIVVISGDEQMARFQEGVSLYERGMGKYLVFSGAAYDNG